MKTIALLAAAGLLAGCASAPRPAQHPLVGSTTADGWRVVSVTPVGQEPQETYYAPPPPPAYYVAPPVTFSLGIMLGRSWRHHGRRR